MHLVACKIALGGDTRNIVHRQAHNPVSWPEVGVLKYLHGEESVFDVEVVTEVPSPTRQNEKRRLAEKYGQSVLEMVYPGANPFLELEVPGHESPKPEKPKERRRGVTITPLVPPEDQNQNED